MLDQVEVLTRFEFKNFIPRAEFLDYANHALDRMVQRLPSDAAIRAEAIRTPFGFQFRLSARSVSGTFEAKTMATPDENSKSDRMWQKLAVDDLFHKISEQVFAWRERNAA